MNRQYQFLTIILLTLLFAAGMIILNSRVANAEPGSATDPLVSKSYVDDKINQIMNLLGGSGTPPVDSSTVSQASKNTDYDEIVSDVMAQITFLYGDKLDTANTGDSSAKYIPVSAAAGQIIIGDEGTEIILRSGAAVGYCPGENGIVDATDGVEIFNNAQIKANHILIVPRDDFRGVRVMQDAWFIIKGEYSLLD